MKSNKMLTFDSFTLVPSYSDIISRSEVDISTQIYKTKSDLPIINANMLSISTEAMMNVLINSYNTFGSYHRFFDSENTKKDLLMKLPKDKEFRDKFWMSVGTKSEEYSFIEWLYKNDFKNIIVDVNHGHHKMVKDVILWTRKTFPEMCIMAGNVSSTDGILFLRDAGADVVKCGNSFGNTCSSIKASGVGVHPIHVIKSYREETEDWDTALCADGGIRLPADIAKCLIWANVVMIGSMLGGTDESFGTKITTNGITYKEIYGNASAKTKQVVDEENHIKYIEGETRLVPYTGSMNKVLKSIKEGLQSSFSFVGARNLQEFQSKAISQILYI